MVPIERMPDSYIGALDPRTPTPVMLPYERALKLLEMAGSALRRIGVDHDLSQAQEDVRAKAIAQVGIDPRPNHRPIEEAFPIGTRLRWVQTEGLSLRHPKGHPPPHATIVGWSPVWSPDMNTPRPKEFYGDRLEVLFDGDDEPVSLNEYMLRSSFARIES